MDKDAYFLKITNLFNTTHKNKDLKRNHIKVVYLLISLNIFHLFNMLISNCIFLFKIIFDNFIIKFK